MPNIVLKGRLTIFRVFLIVSFNQLLPVILDVVLDAFTMKLELFVEQGILLRKLPTEKSAISILRTDSSNSQNDHEIKRITEGVSGCIVSYRTFSNSHNY